ncbi:hypothetical protein MYCTH_36460, partial [Thermothelomyces thermophilus ATCC 42464]
GSVDMGVDTLWRLGRLQPGLGLGAGLVARLRGPMERFVKGLGKIGGWTDYAIAATRGRVLDRIFAAAQQSLLKWTIGIGCRPCANLTCNTNRMAAINVFLLWSGLYPPSRLLSKSISEMVSALQYITATDAELSAAA